MHNAGPYCIWYFPLHAASLDLCHTFIHHSRGKDRHGTIQSGHPQDWTHVDSWRLAKKRWFHMVSLWVVWVDGSVRELRLRDSYWEREEGWEQTWINSAETQRIFECMSGIVV